MELKISMFKVVSYEGLVALCTNERVMTWFIQWWCEPFSKNFVWFLKNVLIY